MVQTVKLVKEITLINRNTGEEDTLRWTNPEDLFRILDNLPEEFEIKR